MSSEFPFIGAMRDAAADDMPLFQEYAWDFERDCFLYDVNGRHILLTGNPALEVWVYKALKTERFEYLAYSWQYGIELKPFIGKVMGVQERYSELRRVITECLMVNPYIRSIDSFSTTPENRAELVRVHITLTTVYGEVEINV
jgi:phage protein